MTTCTRQTIEKRTLTLLLCGCCHLLNEGKPSFFDPPAALTTKFDLLSVEATTDLAAADDDKSGSDG